MNSPLSLLLLGFLTIAAASNEARIANHCGKAPHREPRETLLVPASKWASVSGTIELPPIKGGDDHYRVMCSEGCTYTFSFCSRGGSCDFDSGLSIWNQDLTGQLGCNMNLCGLGSELTWTAPADGIFHLRIGGLPEGVGRYTLGYGMSDATCGSAPVHDANWSLVKRLFRE